MVLAAEVRDRMGRLLMTAGQELSDRALRVFPVAAVESQFSDVTRAILEGSLA